MEINNLVKSDFDQILDNLSSFWGNDAKRLEKFKTLHHPIFLYEFGDTAFVIKDNGKVIAYLLGFLSTAESVAYVQFIAVHKDYKRMGLAAKLYTHFINKAKEKHYKYIKAITLASNETSIKFHTSIGMKLQGDYYVNGVPVVKDYAGPNEDRVVFLKEI